MTRTPVLFFISLLTATLALTSAFIIEAGTSYAIGVGLVGIAWAAARPRKLTWAPELGFVGFVGFAALGIRLNANTLLLLLGVTAAVAAWDLNAFERRIDRPSVAWDSVRGLERSHSMRLLAALAIGAAGGWIARSLQIPFLFWPTILLGLIAVLGLSQVVGYLGPMKVEPPSSANSGEGGLV